VSDHLGYFPDVMPTFAEAAGVECSENIDGISVLAALVGEKAAGHKQKDHEYLYWEFMDQTAVRCGDWKAYKPRKGPWELYDLSKDIEEKDNVAAENPAILAKMTGYAAQAHQPHVPGDIVDTELCMKDHQKAKNPKPSERPGR
jgi:arylsulfatase A-like enzyme